MDRYVLDYSAKSVAVFGDTKPIKDTLKARGGRFNKALWDSTSGQLSAGWVLAIKEKEGLLADAALGVVLKVGTVPKPEKPAEDTQEKVKHAAVPVEGAGAQADGDSMSKKNDGVGEQEDSSIIGSGERIVCTRVRF